MSALTEAGVSGQLRARPGVLRRLTRNRSALIGSALVLTFVLLALLAPILPLADPLKSNFLAIRKPPRNSTGSEPTKPAAIRSRACSSERRPRSSPGLSRSRSRW